MNAIFSNGRMPGFEQVTIFKLFAKKIYDDVHNKNKYEMNGGNVR